MHTPHYAQPAHGDEEAGTAAETRTVAPTGINRRSRLRILI